MPTILNDTPSTVPAPIAVQQMQLPSAKQSQHAAVAWAFAQESAHRLYEVLEELAGKTFATVRQRVVRHLLDLAASRRTADGRLVALVNQQDLANSVGSVREVVARILHELRAAS